MKNRLWILIAPALFSGLLVTGLSLNAAEAPPKTIEIKPGDPATKPAPATAVRRMGDRTEFMARYLELTEEQKKKIRPVYDEETKKFMELRKATEMPAEERRTKYQAIREETNAKLKKLLTEEQWEKYSKRGQRRAPSDAQSPRPVRPAQ